MTPRELTMACHETEGNRVSDLAAFARDQNVGLEPDELVQERRQTSSASASTVGGIFESIASGG
jgi:hypothetical protein